MDKKYELTRENTVLRNCILYRIKALKDFGDVKKEIWVVILRMRVIYHIKVTVGCMILHVY